MNIVDQIPQFGLTGHSQSRPAAARVERDLFNHSLALADAQLNRASKAKAAERTPVREADRKERAQRNEQDRQAARSEDRFSDDREVDARDAKEVDRPRERSEGHENQHRSTREDVGDERAATDVSAARNEDTRATEEASGEVNVENGSTETSGEQGEATDGEATGSGKQGGEGQVQTQLAGVAAAAKVESNNGKGKVAAQTTATATPGGSTEAVSQLEGAPQTQGMGAPVGAETGGQTETSGGDPGKQSTGPIALAPTAAEVDSATSGQATPTVKTSQSTTSTTAGGGINIAALNASATAASTASNAAANAANAQMPQLDDPVEQAAFSRVARGLQGAVKQGGGVVTLRLNPPELGLVRIEMEILNGTVRANLQSETASVRTLLSQQLNQLRSGLESQGLSVERLNVQGLSQLSNANLTSGDSNQQSSSQQSESHSDGRSRGEYARSDSQNRQDGGRDADGNHPQSGFERAMENEAAAD